VDNEIELWVKSKHTEGGKFRERGGETISPTTSSLSFLFSFIFSIMPCNWLKNKVFYDLT
jgi:hypothetical protein